MKLIVAVSQDWCIGNDNDLLEYIPEDMKYFKDNTINKVVVVGRKTFDAFPSKFKPLPNRINIVLTKDEKFVYRNTLVCDSIENFFKTYINYFDTNDIIIIGGSSIYEKFLPYCNEALVTIINTKKKGNKYFPNLNKLENWKMVEQSEEKQYKDVTYTFTKYINKGL